MHLHATTIKFSKIFFAIVLSLYLFAFACVFAVGVPYSVKIILFAVLFYLMHRSMIQPKHLFSALGKDIDGWWFVVDFDNDKHIVELLPDSIVTRYFVLLSLRYFDGRRETLPLFFDSIDKDDFRKARVILK